MGKTTQDSNGLSRFKTKPFEHQLRCLNEHGRKEYFALLAEMGTGKTWIVVNDIADLWSSHDLDAVLIFAPCGVHTNWTLLELPKHMPEWVRYRARSWNAGAGVKEQREFEKLYENSDSSELRVLAMNWEALQTKRGVEAALRFAKTCRRLMIVADESSKIKNPSTARFKALNEKLKPLSHFRRIMDGTPVDGSPFSLYAPFSFLSESILRTTSYYAFKAEYADMIDEKHGLIKHIQNKQKAAGKRVFTPQVVARNRDGSPKYKNLEKLHRLIGPHSFRVLKKDCLDLPEKIYKNAFFDLTPEQRAVYKKAEKECRLVLEGRETPFNKLVALGKLAQITSGYYIHPDATEPVRIPGENPKLELLKGRVEEIVTQGDKVIVWARYKEEIREIVRELEAMGIRCVSYFGEVSKADRIAAIEEFERGEASVFVGNQQAGGTGITLVAASYVIYYSNTFSLGDRLQSEDRAHRIGQRRNVTYINLIASGTVDFKVVLALSAKKNIADLITGDRAIEELLGV